ncbi:MAG: hypothetical protein ACRDPB_09050 [Nocardioidaceae bacterium]
MRSELSMASRAEVTTKYARAYAKASKKDKGRVLDQVVEVTGWSRDNARRRLVGAANRPPGAGRVVAKVPRKQRAPKYSYEAAAEGVGGIGRAVREVPRGLDAAPAGRARTAW